MGVVELVDLSAAAALAHASDLQDRLRSEPDPEAIRECQAQMHQLVGDIVSLRNAAELLKREAAAVDVSKSA